MSVTMNPGAMALEVMPNLPSSMARALEALQPGLGGGVVRLAAVAERRGARQVDDAAPLRLGHVLLHGAGHEERTAQVHVHHDVPVGVCHLEQQVVAGDPGVVHQHDRRAQLRGHAVDGGLRLLGVPDVGPHRQRPAAGCLDLPHSALRVGLGEVEDGDGEPVLGQPAGGGRADASGGAGDDGDPAVGGTHEDTRSKSAASPWPPPMHIVSRP
jgi:hypothetical protein